MSVRRRTLAASSALVALSLVLAACGGDDAKTDTPADTPTESVKTANALMLNGQWPLTGAKLEGDLPDHPVYVVKIDNTSSSAPQLGLDQADLVVEEMVEGGLTRLAAFFYQRHPRHRGSGPLDAGDRHRHRQADGGRVDRGRQARVRPVPGSLTRASLTWVRTTPASSGTPAALRPTTSSRT